MANKVVKIAYNPVVARIIEGDKQSKLITSELLTYQVAGAEHMGTRSWDGSCSFYSFKKDTFPPGFLRLVKKRLERHGYTVFTKSKPAPEPKGPLRPVVSPFGYSERYDYQPEVMDRLVKLKRMIAQVATGGGKSLIFKMCAARLGLTPTLFVTTRKSLMYQMMESVQETMDIPVGVLGDGEWSPKLNGINFAIVDTLAARVEEFNIDKEVERALLLQEDKVQKELKKQLKSLGLPTNTSLVRSVPAELKKRISDIELVIRKNVRTSDGDLVKRITAKGKIHNEKRREVLAFLENVQFLCLEEAHEVGSDSFYRIAQACKNAHYRLALTATPFMRDNEEANMRLMAATGPIGIKVSEKLLIDRGILAKPYFKYIKTPALKNVSRGTKYAAAYANGVVTNPIRNHAVVQEVVRAKEYGLTSMILVQRSDHGKNLLAMLEENGVKARFIFGDHKQKERKAALIALGKGEIDCLIGSTILDVGVDVPSVGLIILAGGGKAEVATRQRIGRGLRAKKNGANVCFVVDFDDDFNRHLHKHAIERKRIINETPGFAENVVAEFDYEFHGFKAA